MTPTAPDLARIDTLSAEELRGWARAVFVWGIRPPAPGERAAIMARARTIGIKELME